MIMTKSKLKEIISLNVHGYPEEILPISNTDFITNLGLSKISIYIVLGKHIWSDIIDHSITYVAVPPSGKYIIVGTKAGRVTIYTLDGKKVLDKNIGSLISSLEALNDKFIVGLEKEVSAYDINGGKIWSIKLKKYPLFDITSSPRGDMIAINQGKKILIVQSNDGKKLWSIKTHPLSMYKHIIWSPDNTRIAITTFGLRPELKVYDEEGNKLWQLHLNVLDAKWSPDGKYIAIRTGIGLREAFKLEALNKIKILDKEGKEIIEEKINEVILTYKWHPSSKRILISTGKYINYLFDLESNTISTLNIKSPISAKYIEFLDDKVVLGSKDGLIKVISIRESEDKVVICRDLWEIKNKPLLFLKKINNEVFLALWKKNKLAHITSQGNKRWSIDINDMISDTLSLSPSKDKVAVAIRNRGIMVINAEDGKIIWKKEQEKLFSEELLSLTWISNDTLLGATRNKIVEGKIIGNNIEWNVITNIELYPYIPITIILIPSKKHVIVATKDNKLILVDMKSVGRESIIDIKEIKNDIKDISISSRDNYIAVLTKYNELYIIKITNNKFGTENKLKEDVTALSWSPNDKYLAAATTKKELLIYSIPEFKKMTKEESKAIINSISWINDHTLVLGLQNGSITVSKIL